MRYPRNATSVTLALTLAMSLFLFLACGPASPVGPGESAGITSPAPQEEPTPTLQPTRTPYPDDQEKPPADPTLTPFPTLVPNPVPAGNQARSAESEAGTDWAQEVTDFTRNDYEYDVVMRVRPLSHRVVAADMSADWPNNEPPYFFNGEEVVPWRRTVLEVVEAYDGELPAEYELLSPELMPNQGLEIGREYLLFIIQGVVLSGDFPDEADRYVFSEDQLATFGGKGGFALQNQMWVIDGDTAWRMDEQLIWNVTEVDDLDGAKTNGDRLAVTDFVAAVQAGLQ